MIHYHIIDPVIYLWNLCPLSVSIFSGREKWVRARNFEGRETEGRTMTHVHGQGENHVVDGVCRSYETGLLPLRVIGIQSPSFPPSMIHASRNPYNPTCFQHFSNFYTLILETRHFQLRNFDLDFPKIRRFEKVSQREEKKNLFFLQQRLSFFLSWRTGKWRPASRRRRAR